MNELLNGTIYAAHKAEGRVHLGDGAVPETAVIALKEDGSGGVVIQRKVWNPDTGEVSWTAAQSVLDDQLTASIRGISQQREALKTESDGLKALRVDARALSA